MTWNSLRNEKKLSACSAVGSNKKIDLPQRSLTICPLTHWYSNNDTECFELTDKGALRILKPGTYLFSGGAYIVSNAPIGTVDIAYTTDLDGTSLTRLYEARYQSGKGFEGGLAIPSKAIRVTDPWDVYLRGQVLGESGTLYPTNNSTYLSVIRLSCINEVRN
jgi:hypothetical protein